MDKKSTFIIVGIIVVAVMVFIFVMFQKSTIDTATSDDTASTTAWENAPAVSAPSSVTEKNVVTAKHAYRDGSHIIAGEIPLPTPCHILDSESVVSTDKKHVLIRLVSSVKTDEICAQVITPARFKVTARADKGATITGTLNGQNITFNFIEAGPNEDLDNFELYIKG